MKSKPRYEAYLKTTDQPTNWGFMAFISNMKFKYTRLNGVKKERTDFSYTDDHEAFTIYILEEVKNVRKTKKD